MAKRPASRRYSAGRWLVEQRRGITLQRPTRAAAGMMETANRSGRYLGGAALTLAVLGTCDRIGRQVVGHHLTERGTCECCGTKTAGLRLTDRGRRRLAALRAKKGT